MYFRIVNPVAKSSRNSASRTVLPGFDIRTLICNFANFDLLSAPGVQGPLPGSPSPTEAGLNGFHPTQCLSFIRSRLGKKRTRYSRITNSTK